jgi:hypothetical protein
MMDITTALPGLLSNISRNREQAEKNLVQCRQAMSQLDEESLASIRQLVKKWEHAQSITQFVNAYVQQEGMQTAAREMDAAIAVLQTAMDDDVFATQAQAQMDANERIASPLPSAGQSLESAPADQTNESTHVDPHAAALEEKGPARDSAKTIHPRN